MRKRSPKSAVAELPEKVSVSIREELDLGLNRFRQGDFETRLRARLSAGAERSGRSTFPLPPLRRWAPAAAFLAGAAVITAAILWRTRGPAPSSADLGAALAGLPGFRTLESAPPPPAPPAGGWSGSEAAIFRSFAAAAAAGAAEPVAPAPETLIPRYDLKRKIEILTVEEPIERALELIMNKAQGGMST